MPPQLTGWHVYYFPVLDSTNAFLKRMDAVTLPSLCFCDAQYQGQGRNGAWQSFFNGNLYLSWAFSSFSFRSTLPLEIALTLAKVLETKGIPVLLKWPNDFILYNKKVGGLLIEKLSDRLIIGFGLNITQNPPLVSADFPVSSLYKEGFFATRQDFFVPFTEAVLKVVQQSADNWQSTWQKKDFLFNKWICWQDTTTKIGKVLGIASDGALLIEEAGKKKILYQAKKIRLI